MPELNDSYAEITIKVSRPHSWWVQLNREPLGNIIDGDGVQTVRVSKGVKHVFYWEVRAAPWSEYSIVCEAAGFKNEGTLDEEGLNFGTKSFKLKP